VLTDHGRDKVEQARGTHIAVVRDGFLRHFSEAELRELAQLFERALPEPHL
jgi:DNA-binding MarR family transcriptional regulator